MADIGVIGGGIAGLVSAYRLSSEGHRVTLYEGSDRLGGLAETFSHDGYPLEKFYHVILDSDAHLVSLLKELGLASQLVWRETGMGIIHKRRLYPFNTALDLLRFGAVPLPDRMRTGAAALYITAVKRRALDLDEVEAVPWLRGLFGKRVFDTVWDPLLAAKFGDLRGDVPAYWVWNTLNREKNGKQEVKGYVRGGYQRITDALADAVRRQGGTIRMQEPVRSVDSRGEAATVTTESGTARYDAVVATPPVAQLRPMLSSALEGELTTGPLEIQGVSNVLLVMRRRLSPHYWTAVVDSGFPFQGVVETTHVIPTETVGGRHLVYLMNYCSRDSEPYGRSDELQRQQAIDGLAALYPSFDRADVEAAYVFRSPYVEPVWTCGYLKRRPAHRLGTSRIYLCTTAQAYPMVTAWNTSVKLATETVNILRGGL